MYLHQELGYALHEVHEEADRIEHAVSPRFIEAIARKLGDPELDPHGDPIPRVDGTITYRDLQPLATWQPDTPGVVARLRTHDAAMLKHLLDQGFRLGARVEVLSHAPFDELVTVLVDGQERVVGSAMSSCILLDAVSDECV